MTDFHLPVTDVRVMYVQHTIPVPWGMRVDEAWELIHQATLEKRAAWPEDTLIKCWVNVLAHPNGRIIGIGC